jgi:hypothetical protein
MKLQDVTRTLARFQPTVFDTYGLEVLNLWRPVIPVALHATIVPGAKTAAPA